MANLYPHWVQLHNLKLSIVLVYSRGSVPLLVLLPHNYITPLCSGAQLSNLYEEPQYSVPDSTVPTTEYETPLVTSPGEPSQPQPVYDYAAVPPATTPAYAVLEPQTHTYHCLESAVTATTAPGLEPQGNAHHSLESAVPPNTNPEYAAVSVAMAPDYAALETQTHTYHSLESAVPPSTTLAVPPATAPGYAALELQTHTYHCLESAAPPTTAPEYSTLDLQANDYHHLNFHGKPKATTADRPTMANECSNNGSSDRPIMVNGNSDIPEMTNGASDKPTVTNGANEMPEIVNESIANGGHDSDQTDSTNEYSTLEQN